MWKSFLQVEWKKRRREKEGSDCVRMAQTNRKGEGTESNYCHARAWKGRWYLLLTISYVRKGLIKWHLPDLIGCEPNRRGVYRYVKYIIFTASILDRTPTPTNLLYVTC